MPSSRVPSGRLHSLLAVLAGALGACADYAITVNERTVYTPPALFRDFSLADGALEACVRQHILDERITDAGALQTLDCSHAGIADLTGLELFTGLRRVKLGGNRIADPAPLAASKGLEVLLLDGNRIVDASPLWSLDTLERLDLGGNADLRCPPQRPPTAALVLPAHCS